MKLKLITLCLALLIPYIAIAGDYIIGEGDGLDISVWGVKELNVTVRVRPDGKITIPGLGDVKATGVTPLELQATLGAKFKELVKNPIVTVSVREITNSKVYVFGGGVNSGVYDLNRRTTLLQLLCVIGNSTVSGAANRNTSAGAGAKVADYKKAYILRNGKKLKQDFYKLFVDGDVSEDIVIETNDAIFIPQLLEKNIYVLGAVNTPKVIEYREGMTIMEAVLESGGFTKFAKQNDTEILRKDGKKEISISIKAKDLINDGDLEQNVKLKPGDYVVVKEGMF
ncbi:polysaccharide biosynthesis/export family protein [Geotalea uraniireducens]|uniref:Polysaccharide export protein n=1 Tax=Geotalea uraniireducens (strain Rf4) TaxID=351605 RepID=A5G426_GEOUR|nr:polysaccharide biosynthesis/export family protein [Geotalea uraniireducens]ABQ26544.1 polysaccharide export protein [Geotalea uraniireducens Rf4]